MIDAPGVLVVVKRSTVRLTVTLPPVSLPIIVKVAFFAFNVESLPCNVKLNPVTVTV